MAGPYDHARRRVLARGSGLRHRRLLRDSAGRLTGLGAGKTKVSVDLDAESPHVLISAGTGGGKSTILRCITCQFIHNGAHAYVPDFKRISHTWARGVPGRRRARRDPLHGPPGPTARPADRVVRHRPRRRRPGDARELLHPHPGPLHPQRLAHARARSRPHPDADRAPRPRPSRHPRPRPGDAGAEPVQRGP
ncbi:MULTISPECIES: helicase HerA domain-containing protein [unclassified Streptomyces]|uniref:helicase HerA domain-containing protein n=1 Tax=unclassified Streptomyces TaxID=2593676 RepID=UPI00343CD17A